jgi:hypothetical protein
LQYRLSAQQEEAASKNIPKPYASHRNWETIEKELKQVKNIPVEPVSFLDQIT